MKKILIAASCLLGAAFSAGAEAWSLDSCINYAVSHNLDIRAADLEVERGRQEITEAKDGFLPTLSAGAGQNWDFGRGLTSQNTYANRNTSMFSWQAQMQLPLFQGLQAVRQLRYAKSNLSLLESQREARAAEVSLSVIGYYLQVLYNREMLAVNREQLRLAEVQQARQEVLLEGGKVPEVDVIQARAQVAQSQLQVVNSENDCRLALLDLAKALEIDMSDESFDILPIEDTDLALLSPDVVYEKALQSYPSIRAARQGIRVADDAESLAFTGYLPRLSFNAGLGSSYYTVSGESNVKFSKQMRDNFSKSLGFSLSVPIFDGFSTRNRIRQAKIQRLNAELQLRQQETALAKSVKTAWIQAVAADKKHEAGAVAVEAAKAALDAMTEKYNYGKANATEWEQTRSDYVTSLAQQVQAKYEKILRARVLLFYAQDTDR